MAGKTATLALKITGDASDAKRALDDTESRVGKWSRALGGAVALGAGAGIAALGALGVSAFNAASDLEQSTGAINSVFGDWALDIEQSAQAAAGSVGLSASAYENLAAVIGAQLSGAGMAHDEMTDKTQTLIEKGADLAATFGGTTADAVSALSGVLKGEMDPIERYGVSIKQSDINARLAAQGQDKLTGTALKTATANAALGLVMEQTASSTGQFNRESDSAAGSGQVLSATWDNLKAKLGEQLLPIFSKVATWLTETGIPAFEKLTEKGGPLRDIFEKVSTFVGDELLPTLSRIWDDVIQPKVLPALQSLWTIIRDDVYPAFEKWWTILKDDIIPIIRDTLSPIITAAKDVFDKLHTALQDNKDGFQKIYDESKKTLDFLRDNVAPVLGGTVADGFKKAAKAIGPLIDALMWINDHKELMGVFGNISKVTSIGNPFNAPAPGASGAPAGLFGAAPGAGGSLFAASSSLGGGGAGPSTTAGGPLGGNTYITVTGALDPAAVADQIGRLLDSRARRTGGAPAFARGVRIA